MGGKGMTAKIYIVRDDSDEHDDGIPVTAHSSESAAEEWAYRTDAENDHFILKRGEGVVASVTDAFGRTSRWRVTGEATVHYTAEEESRSHVEDT